MSSGKRLAWTLGAMVLLGGGFALMTQFGSPGNAQQPPARTQFAEGRESAHPADVRKIAFDSARAMRYLNQICDIGPRISGSDGMKKQIELLRKHFTELGAQVELQTF